MVSISGEKVCTGVITWRRYSDFHFSPKGKNGVQNAICHPGVKLSSDIDIQKLLATSEKKSTNFLSRTCQHAIVANIQWQWHHYWWLNVDVHFSILVTKKHVDDIILHSAHLWCWWSISDVSVYWCWRRDLSTIPQTCHQHIWSPTSVNKIDATTF